MKDKQKLAEIAESLSGQVIACRKERLGLPTSDEYYQGIYKSLVLHYPTNINQSEKLIKYKEKNIMSEQKYFNSGKKDSKHVFFDLFRPSYIYSLKY